MRLMEMLESSYVIVRIKFMAALRTQLHSVCGHHHSSAFIVDKHKLIAHHELSLWPPPKDPFHIYHPIGYRKKMVMSIETGRLGGTRKNGRPTGKL